jgi:hypothetical protein
MTRAIDELELGKYSIGELLYVFAYKHRRRMRLESCREI